MTEYVGCRIQFTDDDTGEEVTGTMMSVNRLEGRISIDDVVCAGRKMTGTQLYYDQEMSNFQVLEKKKTVEKVTTTPSSSHRKFLSSGLNNSHLKHLRDVKESDLVLNKRAQDEHPDDVIPTGENFTFRSQSVKTCITVLSELNERFQEAIELLKTETVIGVGLQGVDVGRTGSLCLIQFGLRDCVLIFDIVLLGRAAFEHGLTEILQHPNILKVIHDCRYVSDMLFHKYSVSLVNVFDTQVANAVIFRTFDRSNRYPKYVDGLQQCLLQYVQVDHDEVFPHRVRQSCREEDERVWTRRPLPVLVVETAARTVCRLRQLRLAMMEHLMSEVNKGTDLYLGYVRDQPDDLCITRSEMERKKARRRTHELPIEFQRIPSLLKQEGLQTRRHSCPSDLGMAENCTGIGEQANNIVFSKAGSWFHVPKAGSVPELKSKPDPETESKSPAPELVPSRSPPSSRSPSSTEPKKKPDYHNPLLKPSFMLQRCHLSANMVLPEQSTEPARVKPAGHQENRGVTLSGTLVPLDECPTTQVEFDSSEFDAIPSIPQKAVFSLNNSSDEAEYVSM